MKRNEIIKSVAEAVPVAPAGPTTPAKITKMNPGQSATMQTAPGVTTTIDLKANPTALTKGPDGKLALVTKQPQGTQQGGMQNQAPKVGDEVKVGTESVNRIAAGGHTHGDELSTTGTESPISGDEAADNYKERLRKLAGL